MHLNRSTHKHDTEGEKADTKTYTFHSPNFQNKHNQPKLLEVRKEGVFCEK